MELERLRPHKRQPFLQRSSKKASNEWNAHLLGLEDSFRRLAPSGEAVDDANESGMLYPDFLERYERCPDSRDLPDDHQHKQRSNSRSWLQTSAYQGNRERSNSRPRMLRKSQSTVSLIRRQIADHAARFKVLRSIREHPNIDKNLQCNCNPQTTMVRQQSSHTCLEPFADGKTTVEATETGASKGFNLPVALTTQPCPEVTMNHRKVTRHLDTQYLGHPSLPSSTSSTKSVDTLVNGSEEMIDVFLDPSKDTDSTIAARWVSTKRQHRRSSREVDIDLIVEKPPTIDAKDSSVSPSPLGSTTSSDNESMHRSGYGDLLDELKSWHLEWEMPRVVRPGVAYVPPTTEQHFAEQPDTLDRSSMPHQPRTAPLTPSRPRLSFSNATSYLSSSSARSIPERNIESPSMYSVCSDGFTPNIVSRDQNKHHDVHDAQIRDSLFDEIDHILTLYSHL